MQIFIGLTLWQRLENILEIYIWNLMSFSSHERNLVFPMSLIKMTLQTTYQSAKCFQCMECQKFGHLEKFLKTKLNLDTQVCSRGRGRTGLSWTLLNQHGHTDQDKRCHCVVCYERKRRMSGMFSLKHYCSFCKWVYFLQFLRQKKSLRHNFDGQFILYTIELSHFVWFIFIDNCNVFISEVDIGNY